MVEATVTSQPDPTLTRLVPRRSSARNALLAAVGVAALVAAWFSADVLRVSIADDGAQGGWEVIEDRPEVLAMTTIDPHGWPWVTVESVADVPGARVVGAWVVPSLDTRRSADRARFADTVEYVRYLFPDLDEGKLPTRLWPGSGGGLVVLWEVLDCASLDPDVPAEVRLRSALGTGTREEVGWGFMSPAWDTEALAEYGACP